jgi:hypothetical protein
MNEFYDHKPTKGKPGYCPRFVLSPLDFYLSWVPPVFPRFSGFLSCPELNTLPVNTPVYASPMDSRPPVQDSGPGWSRFPFPVGLFHPLQYAGLSRRSLSPVCYGWRKAH